MSERTRLFALVLPAALLAGGLAVGCREAAPSPQRPIPEVGVMTITPRDVPLSVRFVAQTESSRQVDIVARVSGFLDQIAYSEGELVEEGQLLFRLDPKPFQADLDAAKGELQAQQARFNTAKATLDRVRPLTEQNALSQADLDRAVGDYEASSAAVAAAQAKVRQAELDLGYATITSPVKGLASRSMQRQGAFVNSMAQSAQLTYVAAVDPIWVNFSVSQNQLAKWRREKEKGQVVAPPNEDYDVEVVLPDGTPYPEKGKINFADPSFSQDTGSFLVRAVLPNPKSELRPGMFLTAFLQGAVRPGAIVVPQLAVQQGQNGHLVYVVKKDDTAEVRPVVVGDYLGQSEIVVLSGLHAGDRIVVEGVMKVVAGQPVKAVEAKE